MPETRHYEPGFDGGAETWAILGSLLTTAKLNGLDPYTWLNDVLERTVSGEIKSTSLERCLPWHWKQEHADMGSEQILFRPPLVPTCQLGGVRDVSIALTI
ncbi:hypothetical protein BN77_p30094 [Rhizobium mesoamericanum STM3625]|uniref:Transposase IS66 C-terminal domain-containing protein n=1 Tax=Rhizobium mesoamericanum STM3625 TaxID=1211777 RepID=K0Q060_9HYPH|nr:hypothetical protein BN77_p30094 [Rhizobium mesoamericanum STM3625]